MTTQTILFVIGAALFGSILGMLYFFLFVLKKRKRDIVCLSTDKLTEEVISLKIQIRVMYSIGPIIAILLLILGFDNFRELNKNLEGADLIKKSQEAEVLIQKLETAKYLTSSDLKVELSKYYIKEYAIEDRQQKLEHLEEDLIKNFKDLLRNYYTSKKTDDKISLMLSEELKNYINSIETKELINQKVDNKSLETKLKDYYPNTKVDEMLQAKVDYKAIKTTLKEYYKIVKVDELLQKKVDNITLETTLKDYYKTTKVDEFLQKRVDNVTLETTLKDYYLSSKVDDLLQKKVDNISFETAKKEYYATSKIDELLQAKVDKTSLETFKKDYYSRTQADEIFKKKE